MRRLLTGAAGLTAVVAAFTTQLAGAHYPPGPQKPCPGATDAVQVHEGWSEIKAPPGMERLTAQAAGDVDGRLVLASDGRLVMRSDDAGCTWKPSYDVGADDVGDQHVLPRVAQLAFPAGGRTALMVIDGLARSAGSKLLRSEDGGATWTDAGAGLPSA